MYEVTGNEEVLDKKYRGSILARDEYRDMIEAFMVNFGTRLTKSELFHDGQRWGLRFRPDNTVADLLDDPQLKTMGFWVEMEHPVVGKLKYPLQVLSREDMPIFTSAAPMLGQHNEAIYCGELGLPKEELSILRTAGII
jgi:crotonobetainyl-CoA:carnitine CoA-transferase CaiB-like acyl-CoA transferase